MQAEDANQTNTHPDTFEDRLSELIHGSMSGEFATAKQGKPMTFPLTPFFDPDRGTIVVTSPVAFAGKAAAIESEPRVSILLHDDSGEYLVNGIATVSNDIQRNAAYVRALNELEPDTPKRRANEEKYEFIDTRVGNAIVGWLGERIVIEIEPKSMIRIGDHAPTEALSAWPDVEMDAAEASSYERALVTVVDDDGYPTIRRISNVEITDSGAVFDTDLPVEENQPACVLFHWHDEASIYLRQRVIRGRFRKQNGAMLFVPASTFTLRNASLVDTVRFIIDGKRLTRAYHRENVGTSPPGPTGLPLVRNTLQFLRDPVRFYSDLPHYGDVVRYRIWPNTWTAILHPNAIERVLVSENHRFKRYNFEELGINFIEEGLFFSEGEQWRRQRQVIQPAFAPANLATFSDSLVDETIETIDGWEDGSVISANREFSNLTLEILTATLFDVELNDRHDAITDAAHSLSDRVDTQSLSAVLPGWIPTAKNRDFKRKMERFDAVVADLIEERRLENTTRDDLLSTLLHFSEAEQSNDRLDVSTDKAVRDQLVTLLFAGHETTATALTFACLLLAQHEDVRRQVEAEVDAVCGDRPPAVRDVAALEYTGRVIKETLRRYPPVYVLFREAMEDIDIDGYRIPAGSKVVLPQFLAHRDKRWWDDPESFRPDRWTEEFEDELPAYAYFPFGGGPRHCVGFRFAMAFMTIALATIVPRVEFELLSESEVDLHLAATLSPAADVRLRIKKREVGKTE